MKYWLIFFCLLSAVLPVRAQMNIRVRGVGVDIWNVGSSGPRLMHPKGVRTSWEDDYYKPGQYHLWNLRPPFIADKDYATTPVRGEDGRTCTMESVVADASGTIVIAVPADDLREAGWTKTNISFSSSRVTYHLYSCQYSTPNQYVDIPYNDPENPTLVFAEKGHLTFDNPPAISELAEGVIVARSNDRYNRRDYIVDPNLIILPNGDYIAGESEHRYISRDKGKSWNRLENEKYNVYHASTFFHDGALYIIGDLKGPGGIVRSTDGGETWSSPVRLLDNFRNSPSHVEVANGRIWIAYELLPRPHTVNFLSASTSSDLMDPQSWVSTTRQDEQSTGNETDMVLGRNGWPIAMPKGGGPRVRALSATEAVSSPGEKFSLPASSSKYSIKYDPVSDLYWALTSYSPIKGNVRTGITLFSSKDLITFEQEKVVIQGSSTAFHGFNYPFMEIDGDDIVFVLRTAWENEMGQAQRWHDANMLTFHRIRNFREL